MSAANADQNLLGRLKLRHFRVLRALDELKSAVAVAAHLHVSPAAVSKTLAEIEDIVGLPLFERVQRGLRPTESGRDLIAHAGVLMAQMDRLTESILAAREGSKGDLRIATRTMSVQPLLAETISAFYTAHPRVRISVIEGGIGELVEQLAVGALDLLFAYDDPRLGRPELTALPVVGAQEVVVIASLGHPLLGRRKLTATQLAEQEWCIPADGSRMLHLLHAAFRAHGAAPPMRGIRTSDVAATASLMQAGHFLAVFPHRIAAQLEIAKVARILPFRLASEVEPVVMVWNDVLTPRPHVSLFRDAIARRAGQSKLLGEPAPLLAARAIGVSARRKT